MSRFDEKKQLRCSFCGKSQEQVKRLIAGPNVYICDECVELCQEIIKEEFSPHISALLVVKLNEVVGITLAITGVR